MYRQNHNDFKEIHAMRIEVTLREESGHDEKIVLTVSAGGPYRCAGAWVGHPGRVGGMF